MGFCVQTADNDEEENNGFISREATAKKVRGDAEAGAEAGDSEDDNSILSIERIGAILRNGEGRLQRLATDAAKTILAAIGTDNSLELFRICNQEEVQKRLAKKAKKEKKRTGVEVEASSLRPTVQEQFRRIKPFRAAGKVKAVHVQTLKQRCRAILVLGNNQVEVVHYKMDDQEEAESALKLESQGHR